MSYTPASTLPVTTTGAWARPGWHDLLIQPEQDNRLGPEDLRELYEDYAVLAIQDQEHCGLDILTDGEVRRKSWIRSIVKKVPGLTPRTQSRRLGPYGWDQMETYTLGHKIEDMDSVWDYVDEFKFLSAHTTRPVKICMPGPYGITTQLDFNSVYSSRTQCAEALVPAIRATSSGWSKQVVTTSRSRNRLPREWRPTIGPPPTWSSSSISVWMGSVTAHSSFTFASARTFDCPMQKARIANCFLDSSMQTSMASVLNLPRARWPKSRWSERGIEIAAFPLVFSTSRRITPKLPKISSSASTPA